MFDYLGYTSLLYGYIPSAAIDRFIVAFFEIALNEKGLTAQTVKTIRYRLKKAVSTSNAVPPAPITNR